MQGLTVCFDEIVQGLTCQDKMRPRLLHCCRHVQPPCCVGCVCNNQPAMVAVCRWTNPIDNYDNILMATFTLWQISTTELWVDTMYKAIAAVGPDQQPQSGHNPVLALFFIAFIIFGGELDACCNL